jgi:hypothetical protein
MATGRSDSLRRLRKCLIVLASVCCAITFALIVAASIAMWSGSRATAFHLGGGAIVSVGLGGLSMFGWEFAFRRVYPGREVQSTPST